MANATQRHKQVLVLSIAGTLGFVAALSRVHDYGWLVIVVACMALCQVPITPLVDNSVLQLLGDRSHRYGRVRLWGAVGWGASGPLRVSC